MGGRWSRIWTAGAGALVLAMASAPAWAAAFYVGGWKIVSATMAPWADPKHPLDEAEKRSLMGKTVTFAARGVIGPGSLVCSHAHYHLTTYTADLLFQGELQESASANPKQSALGLAHALGFAGSSWQTLETGCEIDWHFADPTTAKIGLNDYVYTLKKE